MYRKLAKRIKYFSKQKYIHLAYYKDNKKHIKTFKQNQIDVKIGIYCFGLAVYEIDFKKEEAISNVLSVKFSNNTQESFKSIEFSEIYVSYINYDAKNESKGCISQKIENNRLIITKGVTCHYSFERFPSNSKELFSEKFNNENQKMILIKPKDLEIKTVNYDEISDNVNSEMELYNGKIYSTNYRIVRNVKHLDWKQIKRYFLKY